MLRVGLSGGIGSGKSTAAARLAERGALVIDSDVLSREVVAPGSEGLQAVRARFGEGVLAADGSLDRAALGAVVFRDAEARADLEAITHPRIAARAAELVAAAPTGQIVVHDVPLLVEKRFAPRYHLVVIIGAGADARAARLVRTRGLSEQEARDRIAAQADDAARREVADVWLDNTGSLPQLRAAVDRLWRERLVPFNDNLLRGVAARGPDTPVLHPYDVRWPEQATRLLGRLRWALDRGGVDGAVVAAHHIGSTSVPGLTATDVLDLQLVVEDLRQADDPAFGRVMAAAGFPRLAGTWPDGPAPGDPAAPRPDERLHGHADPARAVHLRVRPVDGPEWRSALLFRDWLRAEPGARDAYGRLKLGLVEGGGPGPVPYPSARYAQDKAPWITHALGRARDWAERTRWSPPST